MDNSNNQLDGFYVVALSPLYTLPMLFIPVIIILLLARLKTGYMLAAGPKQIPILQVVPLPRSVSVAPSVGEEVVIEKSKPKDLKTMDEPTSLGCIVDSETEDDTMVTTTLASTFLLYSSISVGVLYDLCLRSFRLNSCLK